MDVDGYINRTCICMCVCVKTTAFPVVLTKMVRKSFNGYGPAASLVETCAAIVVFSSFSALYPNRSLPNDVPTRVERVPKSALTRLQSRRHNYRKGITRKRIPPWSIDPESMVRKLNKHAASSVNTSGNPFQSLLLYLKRTHEPFTPSFHWTASVGLTTQSDFIGLIDKLCFEQ